MIADFTPMQAVEKRFECNHAEQRMVKYQQSNGQWRVRMQCTNCGDCTTGDMKMAGIDLDLLPIRDNDLAQQYRSAKYAARDEARYSFLNQFEQEKLSKQQKWWTNYNHYLQTDHWRNLRHIVLVRDRYQCQNCFCKVTETTAHAHHLSYVGFNRVHYSFAFECVTLCAKCHNEFHAEVDYGW